ncbi:FAD-dependent monooxygenase [Pollutimonas thiosulfatoxidans]|uniref:Monooxygenase n=1 Tax=Pollutimonas thiosulfatoxidans TaxID=2028345 RepID=A0A410G8M5_9BURK|nr:FAD-dependent monooxygenase [Pollutimonas thiosulfatoxidans]QAA92621.1 monooxygenase [Pollutimonas thiosulfatoxidans]
MDTPTYDITISGAGPVGSALALMLAAKAPQPERIALVGGTFADSPTPPAGAARPDPRTLAMNHGSRVLLERLGAWPRVSADICTVHVSQQGRLGRTLIEHADLGVPRLGNVVLYDVLLASLHSALRDSGVTLKQGLPTRNAASGRIEWALGNEQYSSALWVQSDGARPQGITREYGQRAVLSTVRATRPLPGWAFERFTRHGPLALLPHPQAPDLYALVWCNTTNRADELMQYHDEAFADALHKAFGDRLGKFVTATERHVYPLSMHAGPTRLDGRSVAIGNAAQTLHPVAGQGLNLGLRDAAQLTHTLAPWLAQGGDATHALAAFARQRRPDRWLTGAITDFLPRAFTTGNPLVEHAAGLALMTLDAVPALRKPLARQLLQGLRN